MTKRRFITRPTWASELFSKGFEGQQTTNPYNPNRPAWSFVATPELDEALQELKEKLKAGTK